MRGTLHAYMIFIGFIARTIFDVEQRPWTCSQCSLLHSPVTPSRLGPNIYLEHTQPMNVSWCAWWSFTCTQNKTINCSAVYFNPCALTVQFCTDIKHTLLDKKREDRSGRTVAGRSPRNFFMRAVFGLLLSFPSVWNLPHFRRWWLML